MKKPTEFPQGTQRIAPISDEELACGIVGDVAVPVAVSRAKRVTNAYKTETIAIRPLLTIT